MKLLKKIFFVLLLLLIIMAISRTLYNYFRIVSDEYKLIFTSDSVLREQLYGDVYPLFNWVDSLTPHNSDILLMTTDGKPYFYGRYFLFPKKIYWNLIEANLKVKHSYNFVLVYHPSKKTLYNLKQKNRFLNTFYENKSIIAVLYKI